MQVLVLSAVSLKDVADRQCRKFTYVSRILDENAGFVERKNLPFAPAVCAAAQ